MAVVLHSVAVAIFDKRSRTRPLPHRQAGYTQAQLGKMDPNPCLGGPPPPSPSADPPPDPDDLWDEAMRGDLHLPDDDEDPFGFGGSMDGPADDGSSPPPGAQGLGR